MNLFHVDIVSAEKIIYNGEACSLVVPAQLGFMGILANHAPLITHLNKGRISLRDNANNLKVFELETSGFMEVLRNKATLIINC